VLSKHLVKSGIHAMMSNLSAVTGFVPNKERSSVKKTVTNYLINALIRNK